MEQPSVLHVRLHEGIPLLQGAAPNFVHLANVRFATRRREVGPYFQILQHVSELLPVAQVRFPRIIAQSQYETSTALPVVVGPEVC